MHKRTRHIHTCDLPPAALWCLLPCHCNTVPLAAASSSSALTLIRRTLNLQKRRRNHVADTQRPHLCRTTLMSGSIHSAQGVPCISMERLDEGFPPARISNLRQAPASRDIPCLTNLALLPWEETPMWSNFLPWQGRSLASITGISVFIFLLCCPSSSH